MSRVFDRYNIGYQLIEMLQTKQLHFAIILSSIMISDSKAQNTRIFDNFTFSLV